MKEKLKDIVDLIDSRTSIIQSDIYRLQVELDDLKGKINLKQDRTECNCGCKEYKPIKANRIHLGDGVEFIYDSKSEEDSDSNEYKPVRTGSKDSKTVVDLDSGEFTIKSAEIDGFSSTVESTSVKIDANGIKIKVNKGEVVVTEDGLIISIN